MENVHWLYPLLSFMLPIILIGLVIVIRESRKAIWYRNIKRKYKEERK